MTVATNDDTRPLYYRFLTGISLAVTIGITWQLWSADRSFPTAPLWGVDSWISGNPGIVFKALLIAVSVLFAFKVRFSGWVLAILLLLACMDDLNRIRPDTYQYFVIVILFGFTGLLKEQNLLNSFRIMQGGIYLWTGIQKLNPGFLHEAPKFFFNTFHIVNPAVWYHYVILIIPLLEILIGLSFLAGRKIMPSLIVACILHALIVIQLAVSGWNLTMIPYNLFLVIGNFILFVPLTNSKIQISIFSSQGFMPKISIALFLVLPALNFGHLWPSYMSAGMYSYRTPYAAVSIDKDLQNKLPDVARRVIYHSGGVDYVAFNYWDHAESGCIPNPEPFAYRKIFEQLQYKYKTTDSVKLYIY